MSISAISSTTSLYQNQLQSDIKQRSQDFMALQSALQSNDLTGAQKAFAAFQQDLQGPSAASKKSPNDQAANDLKALQTALQSGDLATAQQAFATLKQDVQSAHKAHHHHHQDNNGDANGSGSASTPPAASVPANGIFNQQA
jgi:hypothetical protein